MVSMVRAGRPDPSEAEPPTDELPGVAPTGAIIARSADVVVSVDHVLVHTTGVRIAVGVRFSDTATPHQDFDPALLAIMKNQAGGPDHLAIEFGIGDAVIATTSAMADRAATRHRVTLIKARGGAQLWELEYWLRPLPDTDVTLAATWPAAGVRARNVSLSYDAMVSASQDVVSLFP